MSNKPRNPNIDYGFHFTLPRMVRTGYKKVSPAQKWVYGCLKDLCGDNGTCYRTLRVLSGETGVSTGMLSETIPVLHDAGLIHAEKKKRSTGGKEVWHITIVDIWQANAKAHPTKRSQNEQTQKGENVHKMNVHNLNNPPTQECSQNERECSQNRDRSNNTLSNNNNEGLTESSALSDDNRTLTSSLSFSVSEENIIPPQITLPQKPVDNQPVIDEAIDYLSGYRYSVEPLEIDGDLRYAVLAPHERTRRILKEVSFLELYHTVKQDSSQLRRIDELDRFVLSMQQPTTSVRDIMAEIDRPDPPIMPTIPNTETPAPLQASNSPSVEEPPNHTASSVTMPRAGSQTHTEARLREDESASMNSSKRAVSHSQGDMRNDVPETAENTNQPVEIPAPEQPARRRRKKANDPDFSPIPAPARPDADMAWTVEKCMSWGNYARKSEFAVSNRADSKYRKALEAARRIIGLGITENNFLTLFFNWMKGVNLNLEPLPDTALKSTSWKEYSVDLWVFLEHYEEEARRYKQAKANGSVPQKSTGNRDEVTVGAAQTRQPENVLPDPDADFLKRYKGLRKKGVSNV